jgi:hypothetical protein
MVFQGGFMLANPIPFVESIKDEYPNKIITVRCHEVIGIYDRFDEITVELPNTHYFIVPTGREDEFLAKFPNVDIIIRAPRYRTENGVTVETTPRNVAAKFDKERGIFVPIYVQKPCDHNGCIP